MADKTTSIFLHEIKLPEKDEFSKRFNHVSELYAKSQDESLTEEERKEAFNSFWSAKYCLEQGLPL